MVRERARAGVAGDGQALNVPQAEGVLVKQGVKDSMGGRLGLRRGNRIGIVEGQQIPIGGDIVLSIMGIPATSNENRPPALEALEFLRIGDDLRVTVLRDDKVVELTTKFTGF